MAANVQLTSWARRHIKETLGPTHESESTLMRMSRRVVANLNIEERDHLEATPPEWLDYELLTAWSMNIWLPIKRAEPAPAEEVPTIWVIRVY